MRGSVSTRVLPAVIVSITVIVALGVLSAPGAAGDTDPIDINESGTPVDIVPGGENQTVSDVEVISDQGEFENDRVQVYFNLTDLQKPGVDLSAIEIDGVHVDGGDVAQSEVYKNSNGEYILGFEFVDTTSDGLIEIKKFKLTSLDTTSAEGSTGLSYEVQAVNGPTEEFEFPDSDGVLTDTFTIAEGDLQFNDQATLSSTAIGELFTNHAYLATNVTANTDSVLIAAHQTSDGIEIIETKSASFEELNDDQVTISTDNRDGFPGELTVYAVPESKFNESKYLSDDHSTLSNQTRSAALNEDNATVFYGSIDFEDREFNESVDDRITLSQADLTGESSDPSFVISLHPVDESGSVLTETFLGSSDVLSGSNDDVPIHLEDDDGGDVSLSETATYAASVRLVDDNYSVGDHTQPGSFELLPNSDPEYGYVSGGVANDATLTFDINDSEVTEPNTDQVFSNSTTFDEVDVYSGQMLSFQVDTDSNNEEYHMHRVLNETDSEVVDTNSVENDSNYVNFKTRGLESNEYFVEGTNLSTNTFDITHQDLNVNSDHDKVAIENTSQSQNLSLYSNKRDKYISTISVHDSEGTVETHRLESIFNGTDTWNNITENEDYYLNESMEELDRRAIHGDQNQTEQFLLDNKTIYLFGGDQDYELNLSELSVDEYQFNISTFDTDSSSTKIIEITEDHDSSADDDDTDDSDSNDDTEDTDDDTDDTEDTDDDTEDTDDDTEDTDDDTDDSTSSGGSSGGTGGGGAPGSPTDDSDEDTADEPTDEPEDPLSDDATDVDEPSVTDDAEDSSYDPPTEEDLVDPDATVSTGLFAGDPAPNDSVSTPAATPADPDLSLSELRDEETDDSRITIENLPGFGPVSVLAALATATLSARRASPS